MEGAGPALMTEWFELWTTKFGVSVQNWSVPLWSNQHFMLPRLIKGGTGSPENLQVKNNNGSFLTQTIFTCSKLTKQTIEQGVNFEHILTPCSSAPIVNFEQVISGWVVALHVTGRWTLSIESDHEVKKFLITIWEKTRLSSVWPTGHEWLVDVRLAILDH